MQQADLIQPLLTILIIVGAVYAFRFLVRHLFPVLLRLLMKRMEKRVQENFRQHTQGHRQEQFKEGEVTIDYGSDKKSSGQHGNSDDEYVDFEEVE